MKRKDFYIIMIFCSLILGVVIVFGCSPYLFGSKTDWLGQHIAFPEYFRNQFYETGNFFPNFAFHLGSGQNIFNFSYYGLFNPIILISYMLPFVSMKTYIMGASLLAILASMILLYYFLKNKLGEKTAFICSILYFLACPILFHAHRHIMFVNYMPFLIAALIAVDRYFQKKKSGLLILNVFLMILTSYYYSIGGIVCILLYGVYCWLQKNTWDFKLFVKDGISFLLSILLGVLLSSFLLFPTAYCLLNGRGESDGSASLLSLFIPNWNLTDVLYTTYSLGLTSIWILTLLYFISNPKRENKFLGILLLMICFLPIFSYLLNGTLYIRTKVLIPFLPLTIYMIGIFINDLWNQKVVSIKWILFVLVFHVFVFLLGKDLSFYCIDLLVMMIAIYLYNRYTKKWLFIFPLLIVSFIPFILGNMNEGYVKKSYSDTIIKQLVEKIPSNEVVRTGIESNTLYGINQVYNLKQYNTSLYSSIDNDLYHKFFKETSEQALPYRNQLILATSNNVLFQTIMGEKYSIRSLDDKIGSTVIAQQGKLGLYQNQNAFPIGYGMIHTISETEFLNLSSQDRMNALLKNIVVKKGNTKFKSDWIAINPTGTSKIGNNITISHQENQYNIDVSKKDQMIYTFDSPIQNQIIWLEFTVEKEQLCKDGDLSIDINDITNKLTCKEWQYKNENHTFTYVLSQTELKELIVTFSKGHFELTNFHIYQMDPSILEQEYYAYQIDSAQTNGDQIVGMIEQKEDGYFVLSIPYDTGFTILVDGKEIQYEKVNTAFIGFPLSAGNHKIEIMYHAPYAKLGIWMSGITLIVILIIYIYKKRHS